MADVKITLKKSLIGCKKPQIATAEMRIGFSSWLIASWNLRLKSSALRSFSFVFSSSAVSCLISEAFITLSPPLLLQTCT